MNSFMKAKKEEMKSSNVKTIPKSLEKEKKEEKKTSSTFTFKDFQNSINKKDLDTKTSIPTQTNLKSKINSTSSLIVEKRNEEKIKEEIEEKIKEEIEEEIEEKIEEEIEEKIEEEKETEYNCEDESESECESESENESDFEDEEDKEDKKLYSELFKLEPSKSSHGEYKVVKICLVPFIFTEEYKKINGLTLDTKISHYSALDKINSYIISENQFKLIEDQIKKKISRLLNTDTKNIKIKLDKSNNCRFEYICYVKVYKKVLYGIGNENYCSELEFSLFEKTDDEFDKYYKEKYKKEYKANPDYVLLDIEFKYLEDYLKIYLGNIYIHDNYCEDVLCIINRNFNFINPFQFIENTIAFKKIKTKSKGVINTTIMKMGFIFNYVREIKKYKD